MTATATRSNEHARDAGPAIVRPHMAVPRRLLRLRSDTALAERFADGDEAAFGVLFERHRAGVLAVCIGVLGSSHDAEDAAQDAFASLAVALRTAPPRELRPWLARVARNAAIDVARRRRTRAFADCELTDDGPPAIDGVITSHGLKLELESVLSGIRELPESQRTALLMRELGGHTYAEIATLLATDEAAVRGLIARARIGLRSHREAVELPCAAAREAMAAEPDGRRHDKTVRGHVRGCAACRSYRHALRDDARALRGLVPLSGGGFAGGGALVGGLAAKGALLGATASQITAACAVSVCAVGGIVLLAPPGHVHRGDAGAAAARRATAVVRTTARNGGAAPSRRPASSAAVPRAASAETGHAGTASRTVVTPGAAQTTAVHSARSVKLSGRFTTPSASTTRTRGATSQRDASLMPLGGGGDAAGSPSSGAPPSGQPAGSRAGQGGSLPGGDAGTGALGGQQPAFGGRTPPDGESDPAQQSVPVWGAPSGSGGGGGGGGWGEQPRAGAPGASPSGSGSPSPGTTTFGATTSG